MMIDSFLKIVEQIEYSCLSAAQKEEMIIQVADLNRFIESYNPEIEVVDWMRRHVNIIRESGEKKGIVLCDPKKLAVSPSFYQNYNCISSIKYQNDLKELWLVYVSDALSNDDHEYTQFLKHDNVQNLYDKIIGLDFLQSRLYSIK